MHMTYTCIIHTVSRTHIEGVQVLFVVMDHSPVVNIIMGVIFKDMLNMSQKMISRRTIIKGTDSSSPILRLVRVWVLL